MGNAVPIRDNVNLNFNHWSAVQSSNLLQGELSLIYHLSNRATDLLDRRRYFLQCNAGRNVRARLKGWPGQEDKRITPLFVEQLEIPI